MAPRDDVSRLSARAKEAEEHAADAATKGRAELEERVASARAAAKAQAEKLQQMADEHKGKLSAWWHDLQRSWNEHTAKMRADFDAKRAEHDVEKAERRAERAETDAAYAIDYAYAAIDEADYAVLNAMLLRKEADELAGTQAPA
jgi:hypothetical protein